MSATRLAPLLLATAVLLANAPVTSADPDLGFIYITSTSGNDTLIQGLHQHIGVSYNLRGNDTLAGFQLSLLWLFSNGNTIGPLYDTGSVPNVIYSELIMSTWPFRETDPYFGLQVTDPDTLTVNAYDVNYSPPWLDSGLLVEFLVRPVDTGSIQIIPAPPQDQWSAFGTPAGQSIQTYWSTPVFIVVPCSAGGVVWGDAQMDGAVTAADIIFLVNHVFKGGAPPRILELGDVECTDTITSSDIIGLVNYTFKAGASPCDHCAN